MSSVLAKWMNLFLVATIMFTPILVYIDSLHRDVVDTVLQQGLNDASVKGYVDDQIKTNIVRTLVDDYNFYEPSIVVTGTAAPQDRGKPITLTIQVPRGPIFLLNIFNQGSDKIERTATVLSEYVTN